MQFQIGNSRFQGGEFALRFLHPVFAEQALARRQRFADAGFVHGLGHRDQLGRGRGLERGLSRRLDARQYGGEIFGNAHAGCLVARETSKSRRVAPQCGHAAGADDRRSAAARSGWRRRALPRGSLVIVRAREAKAPRARWRRNCASPARGLILLIADDPALARAIGADGLHLPEARAREAPHWRARNPGWLITAAAHSLGAVLRRGACRCGVAVAGLCHRQPSGAPPLTPVRARLIARGVAGAGLCALGGVTARNAALLRRPSAASPRSAR